MRFLRLEMLMMMMGLGLLGLFVRHGFFEHGQPLDAIIGVALLALAAGNLEWRASLERVRTRLRERRMLRRALPRLSGLAPTSLPR